MLHIRTSLDTTTAAEEGSSEWAYRLNAIVQCIEDAITIKSLEGRFLFLNAQALASLGLSEAEAVGKDECHLVEPEVVAQLEALDEKVLTKRAPVSGEVVAMGTDGSLHHQVLKYPYFRPDGVLGGVVTISRDITERKRMKAALQTQNEQLRTLDVMKTDFLNMISHELRTPLTSILAYGEFLEDGLAGELTPPQREYLDQIQDSTRRLQRLVDDLLDIACEGRHMKLVFREADMGAKIEQVVDSLRPQMQRRAITFDLALPPAPVTLLMDVGRIGQVLLNLLGNAIKFTPDGGHLAVRLSRSDEGVRVEVSDNGIGIATRDLPRVFDRFFQADSSTTRESGGTGLGLYICRAIIDGHGGQIDAESVYGRGSRFWFTLPACELVA